jgi:hypothetical protein
VIANPKPQQSVVGLDGERTEVTPNASRPISTYLLEVERRVIRVMF